MRRKLRLGAWIAAALATFVLCGWFVWKRYDIYFPFFAGRAEFGRLSDAAWAKRRLSPREYGNVLAWLIRPDYIGRDKRSYSAMGTAQKLYLFTKREDARVLIKRLDDPAYRLPRWWLMGLLAACGGPEAAAYLKANPDWMPPGFDLATPRQQPAYPREINPPDEWRRAGPGSPEGEVWSEIFGAPGEPRYVLFNSAGLGSDRDLYLAIDETNDASYEQVWPTGLSDDYWGEYEGRAPVSYAKAAARLERRQRDLLIWHHVPRYDGQGKIVDADFIATPVTLEELTRDTDKDGLSDITERLLLTDPAKPDTDGDGLPDGLDLAPLAAASQMGRRERGVARALRFAFSDPTSHEQRYGSIAGGPGTGCPYHARYVLLGNTGRIAFVADQYTYNICLSAQEVAALPQPARDRFERSAVQINLVDAEHFAPPSTSHSVLYDRGVLDKEFAIKGRTRYLVPVDYQGGGYIVYLSDVEGELYPAIWFDFWIS